MVSVRVVSVRVVSVPAFICSNCVLQYLKIVYMGGSKILHPKQWKIENRSTSQTAVFLFLMWYLLYVVLQASVQGVLALAKLHPRASANQCTQKGSLQCRKQVMVQHLWPGVVPGGVGITEGAAGMVCVVVMHCKWRGGRIYQPCLRSAQKHSEWWMGKSWDTKVSDPMHAANSGGVMPRLSGLQEDVASMWGGMDWKGKVQGFYRL